MTQTLLQIDSSARMQGSTTRALTTRIAERLGGALTRRDLSSALPQIDENWVNANFTPEADRTPAQRAALALSDQLVAEIKAADVLIIGVPVYNFGIPTALKAWIDQIARAGVTFRYTEAGPEGLLNGKRAILAVASGGTKVGSDIDFATGYMRHILGFIGITDVTLVSADEQMIDAERAAQSAEDAIARLAA
ncbi:FMN-dependent NADH-azoreductase [Roseovarius faecimaris]|uniref:FMN dependent NADH:quinone oxidoreductase n=1 Tax=Roseovarius faecimaris TaxID=2494550 RepID=A0A6I6IVE1_9RHOB|nr:NAD(P)H-dependent oxidoreductase [Roseovarius faecimaris]QGX99611.1 FMN-dependent NADH-azoreductase [Roseovarius faecimaris]